MATAADPEDQPDANQISDPVLPLQQDESPKTLTLETVQPQDKDKPDDQDDPIEEEANLDDPDLTVPSSPTSTDLQVTTTSTISTATSAVGSRRGGGPKRKTTKQRFQEKKSQKKLEVLTETLKPIPFVPNKDLDFLSHETLLKRLGLWDFVNLEFDPNVRSDLIAQLIATYDPKARRSYVNGCRIGVNRADLARALMLKKDKDKDSAMEVEESKESIAFIEDFVSNWVLLHEDTWMMPVEVLNWNKIIKEGRFEKVDWAGLIWFMVEKELSAPKLGNCYYASHMQCLIKHQKEELLQEEPKMDVNEAKEEEEERNIHGDVKRDADGIDEVHGGSQLEEHNIELSLGGQDNLMNKDDDEKEIVGGEDDMDCEETKVDEHQNVQWHLNGDSYNMSVDEGHGHFLRQCNLGDISAVDLEEEKKQDQREEGDREDMDEMGEGEEEENLEEEEEEEEQEPRQEEGFAISPKADAFEGVNSTNLLEAMDTADLPLTGMQIRDISSAEFLASRGDTQTVPGVSSFLGNGNKREIGHDNDFHHSPNGSSKRLRTDGLWADKSSDFEICMEQMQQCMAKARMLYAAKDQAYADSSMHQQMLVDELQRKDSIIGYLQKSKYEEQTKRQVEVYRLERELFMMGNLLSGYRKALKETNRAFAEYRARCPLSEEQPLYKDVSGSGGLVVSSTELEKMRLKQEEEDRLNKLLIEKKIKDFEAGWIGKFDAHKDAVSLLSTRLIDAENDVKLLKESSANRKAQDTPECVPEES
ncbi:hypothetical protein CCACVL1_09248 [Corchorus capsularis]|uniref:Uncharacterized protein n=1 Tax=Corchorus capsularis TaxID=210143 RepID=A0A1R3IX53_COCAP|nr:hypothetical protein CCACVL1_09248 [Corchorus capsularis]